MKTYIKHLSLLSCAGLVLMLAGGVTAQTFTNLYSFTALSGPYGNTNIDGANPGGALILSGNTLYGVAGGGSFGVGTVFAVHTDGSGFTNLHSFIYGSDGAGPSAGILSRNTLYGTASQGGSFGAGTVFAVNTDGSGFTNLHNFTSLSVPYSGTNSDGANPAGGLILSGNTLYGAAYDGGSSGLGTVFALNTDGSGFTNLHSFIYGDGAYPLGLALSGNTLYGTASQGGSFGGGTVFAVNTDGSGFTNLHSFIYGSDGAAPGGALILSGNTLYGTAGQGGSSGSGTAFKLNTDGSGFTNLHSFGNVPSNPPYINSDGYRPEGGLILSGNTLYGTAFYGGSSGKGTVFAVHTDGTGFTNLHSFIYGSDGAGPEGGLFLSGNTLYGTAYEGGNSGNGTIFSISFTPQLTITPSAANVVLTWPTNVAGFDYTGYILQSATNLVSPVWTTVSPPPTVVNGQNTVTNPVSGTQMFFRLSQ